MTRGLPRDQYDSVSGDAQGIYIDNAVRDEGYVRRFTPEQDVPFCSVSGRVRYHPGSGDLRCLVFGLFWCQGLSKPATQHVRTVVRSPASIPRR
jgi:hypothetical protein